MILASRPVIPADPLPWLTPRFVQAGCFAPLNPDGSPDRAAAEATLTVIQTIVNGLSDDSASFTATFNTSVGSTDWKRHEVAVGIGVLLDPDLTDGQRAAIILGAVYHEVGHVRYTPRTWGERVRDTYGEANKLAFTISNVAKDVMLEDRLETDFPGYVESLAVTLWWAGHKGKRIAGTPDLDTPAERASEGFSSFRYPWTRDWASWPHLDEWREEWRAWSDRCRKATTLPKHLIVLAEGLALAQVEPPADPEPEADEDEPLDEPPVEEEYHEGSDWGDDDDSSTPPDDEPEPDDDEGDSPDGDDTESGAKLGADEKGTDDSEPETKPGEGKDEADDDTVDDEPEGSDDGPDGEGKAERPSAKVDEPEGDDADGEGTDEGEGDGEGEGPGGGEAAAGDTEHTDGDDDHEGEGSGSEGGSDSLSEGDTEEGGEDKPVDGKQPSSCPTEATESHFDEVVMRDIVNARAVRERAPKRKVYTIAGQAVTVIELPD